MRLNAREHRARAAPTTSTLATIDHRATSLGPRCAIATSTATIRVPVDRPTINHRERLWDRGGRDPPICEISPQKKI